MTNAELFDVYSIQNKAEEILYALDQVTNEDEVILYTNLDSTLKMETHTIPMKFSNAIFVKLNHTYLLNNGNQRHGKLIKIMDGATFSEDLLISSELAFLKNDELTIDNIESILKAKNIHYQKVKSEKTQAINNITHQNIPEIWFGRDIDIFFDATQTTNDKNVNLYTNINGSFSLILNKANQQEVLYSRQYPIGLEFSDKLLLVPSITKEERIQANKDNSLIIRGTNIKGTSNLGYYPIGLKTNYIENNLIERGFNINKCTTLPTFVNAKYKKK